MNAHCGRPTTLAKSMVPRNETPKKQQKVQSKVTPEKVPRIQKVPAVKAKPSVTAESSRATVSARVGKLIFTHRIGHCGLGHSASKCVECKLHARALADTLPCTKLRQKDLNEAGYHSWLFSRIRKTGCGKKRWGAVCIVCRVAFVLAFFSVLQCACVW